MTAVLERPVVHSNQRTKAKVTLQEYLALPEGPPYYEFEDGKLIKMTRPHGRHQEVLAALIAILRPLIVSQNLGRLWPEIAVKLPGETRIYIPDLAFLTMKNLTRYSEDDGRIHGAPDLVIEILSPSTRQRDRTQKMNVYQRAGVQWYWLVEQDDLTIEEFELTDRGYLASQLIQRGAIFQPTLFPDLIINLAELMGESVPDSVEETE